MKKILLTTICLMWLPSIAVGSTWNGAAPAPATPLTSNDYLFMRSATGTANGHGYGFRFSGNLGEFLDGQGNWTPIVVPTAGDDGEITTGTDTTTKTWTAKQIHDEAGGGGTTTNLDYTPSVTQGVVTNSGGTDSIIPLADATNAGLMTATEKAKLGGLDAIAIGQIDELQTLSGVAPGASDNGLFTGTIITDNSTTKTALQEIETAVELKEAALTCVDGEIKKVVAGVWACADDVAGGAGGATNLTPTITPTTITINSDTGGDAVIPAADATNAGLMLPAEKTKLNNLSGTNTGDALVAADGEITAGTSVVPKLFTPKQIKDESFDHLNPGDLGTATTPAPDVYAGSYHWTGADGTLYQAVPNNTVDVPAATVIDGLKTVNHETKLVENGIDKGDVLTSQDIGTSVQAYDVNIAKLSGMNYGAFSAYTRQAYRVGAITIPGYYLGGTMLRVGGTFVGTLPPAVAGMSVYLYTGTNVTQQISVIPVGDDRLVKDGASLTTATQYTCTAAVGNVLYLVAVNDTDWKIMDERGTCSE